MIYFDALPFVRAEKSVSCRWLLCGVLLLVTTMGLTACSSKEKGGGQSLARVNGEEITMLQVNDELGRANVPAGQEEAARKKILESLIDRQVIIEEAVRDKIDRTPDVMQAIARSKTQIIMQAYINRITAKIDKPSAAEVSDYFHKNPDIFANSKQYDMKSLLIASKDLSDGLKAAIDSAKSLDEVEAWMVSHNVRHVRGVASRRTMDMPPEMGARLTSMQKGQLFIVNEGGNSLIVSLVDVKNSPVTFEDAAPRIDLYLKNKKTKEVVDTEITHLRSLAKIEYLNASAPVAADEGKPASAVSATPETIPARPGAGGP